MARFRSLYAVLAPPVLLAVTACTGGTAPSPAPSPPTSTGPIGAANVPLDTTIDVSGSRAALEAGQEEIRRVLESRIGAGGWRESRPAQEVACPSRGEATGVTDTGIGKFYAREMRHPDALDPDGWDRALDEVVRAVEPHGFRPRPTDGGSPQPEIRYVYLVNDHRDELTLSTHPTIGTGYGGFGVCHPWGD
ncbi:hypothetical protein G6027_06180 [Dietzia sp. SLG310A2-38A2]|uniref:hypothetical protein n=1 Tax=Dietzia sp. SLG310A2-38A2 TaxID=1630643 RepID=UPI0015FA767E|nr:hypothetical protein [Dietzia sp. SLG310A2-38A2]MBB1030478.1 hypothetical protein [Dietzia sp. SLG310A2-38A2]